MNQITQPTTLLTFMLGALFNVFAGLDMTSIADYTIKALIGGIIWTAIKYSADYFASRLKKSTPTTITVEATENKTEAQADFLLKEKTEEAITGTDSEKNPAQDQEKKVKKGKAKTSAEKSNRKPRKNTPLTSRFKRKGAIQ